MPNITLLRRKLYDTGKIREICGPCGLRLGSSIRFWGNHRRRLQKSAARRARRNVVALHHKPYNERGHHARPRSDERHRLFGGAHFHGKLLRENSQRPGRADNDPAVARAHATRGRGSQEAGAFARRPQLPGVVEFRRPVDKTGGFDEVPCPHPKAGKGGRNRADSTAETAGL